MKENKVTRTRIVVDVSDEFHTQVKTMAAKRNITISKYVLRALERALQAGAPLTPVIRGIPKISDRK